jgi:hypothetical protein
VRPRPRLTVFVPLAAAAGIAALLLVRWPFGAAAPGVPDGDRYRGEGDTLAVSVAAGGQGVTATWPALRAADLYQVRVYAPDGTLLAQAMTADTAATITADSLRAGSPGDTVYWQVQALDRLRQPLAQSRLIPVVLPTR